MLLTFHFSYRHTNPTSDVMLLFVLFSATVAAFPAIGWLENPQWHGTDMSVIRMAVECLLPAEQRAPVRTNVTRYISVLAFGRPCACKKGVRMTVIASCCDSCNQRQLLSCFGKKLVLLFLSPFLSSSFFSFDPYNDVYCSVTAEEK